MVSQKTRYNTESYLWSPPRLPVSLPDGSQGLRNVGRGTNAIKQRLPPRPWTRFHSRRRRGSALIFSRGKRSFQLLVYTVDLFLNPLRSCSLRFPLYERLRRVGIRSYGFSDNSPEDGRRAGRHGSDLGRSRGGPISLGEGSSSCKSWAT